MENQATTTPQTAQQFTKNQTEFCRKYFRVGGNWGVYDRDYMGIITVLSDAQHVICMRENPDSEYYRQALNDVKCVLMNDADKVNTLIIAAEEAIAALVHAHAGNKRDFLRRADNLQKAVEAIKADQNGKA